MNKTKTPQGDDNTRNLASNCALIAIMNKIKTPKGDGNPLELVIAIPHSISTLMNKKKTPKGGR